MSASVNVSDFVSRSARYVRAATAAANADGNRYLTTQEAKALPKDLKDNFELIRASGPLTTSKFISLYQRNVSIWAGYVDANKDGALSPVEQRKLPGYIKDNVANYLRSRGSAPAATLKDATRASTIAAHEKAYGKSKVSYAKAFAIAARAIFKDDAGPRWLLTQYQLDDTGSVDKARLERDLKKAIKGLKLLGVGRTNENGDDPKANWIFTADVDDGSDNGYWVSVDRKTGEALVTNFN